MLFFKKSQAEKDAEIFMKIIVNRYCILVDNHILFCYNYGYERKQRKRRT